MVNSETLASIIESIIFVSGNAITIKDIAEKLEISEKQVLKEVEKLQKKYDENSGINLLLFNKKLQFCSNPKYADDVATVLNPIRERELSKSMLEVAAIIAYKQPVTRLDLEEIRGVDSEYAIQNLLKLGVIEIVGRKDAVGRPVLFGTTDAFLKRFQISSLEDLPDYNKLIAEIQSIRSDSYLFTKDVYDENKDPEKIAQAAQLSVEDNMPEQARIDDVLNQANANDERMDVVNVETDGDDGEDGDDGDDGAMLEEDFELEDIEDLELPDFLEGEDVDKIS